MAVTYAERPRYHAKEAQNSSAPSTYKINWIRSLQNYEYDVIILEELPEGTGRAFLGMVESFYIQSLSEIGHQLTNATKGGDGGLTKTSYAKGHVVPDEMKAKLRAAKIGRPLPIAHREAIRDTWTIEKRVKQSEALIGNTNAYGLRSEEACKNISAGVRASYERRRQNKEVK